MAVMLLQLHLSQSLRLQLSHSPWLIHRRRCATAGALPLASQSSSSACLVVHGTKMYAYLHCCQSRHIRRDRAAKVACDLRYLQFTERWRSDCSLAEECTSQRTRHEVTRWRAPQRQSPRSGVGGLATGCGSASSAGSGRGAGAAASLSSSFPVADVSSSSSASSRTRSCMSIHGLACGTAGAVLLSAAGTAPSCTAPMPMMPSDGPLPSSCAVASVPASPVTDTGWRSSTGTSSTSTIL
jgi:hypothetical protein